MAYGVPFRGMRAEREHIETAPDVSWKYNVRRASEFGFGWHYHPEVELTLITRGSGTRIVGDSIENYSAGGLTLIGSELPHTFVSSPDSAEHEAIVIQFRPDFLGSEFLARREFAGVARLLAAAARGLCFDASRAVADRLASLPAEPPPERTLALVLLLARLADDAPQARPLAAVLDRRQVSEPLAHRIDDVCAYLQVEYAGPVRLADVAAVAHMTPPAFSRFFRRALGRTMTDYVTELRVAAACRLLADTDLPITEVATRSGYQNLPNFNRRFRTLRGTSPREYRRAVTGQGAG